MLIGKLLLSKSSASGGHAQSKSVIPNWLIWRSTQTLPTLSSRRWQDSLLEENFCAYIKDPNDTSTVTPVQYCTHLRTCALPM